MHLVENWRELRDPLKALGRRACIVIALRAAKRVDVLVQLRNTAVEAAAAGFDVPHWAWYGRTAGGAEAAASEAVLAATVARAASCAVDACTCATNAADGTPSEVRYLVSLDVYRIQKIAALEKFGHLPLAGWDDPRLGPLWPDGPPEWHRKAERFLRELKDKLADRPNPFAPPPLAIHDETRRQLADCRKISELAEQGAFNDLHGQYVLVYNGQFVGHGPDLADAR